MEPEKCFLLDTQHGLQVWEEIRVLERRTQHYWGAVREDEPPLPGQAGQRGRHPSAKGVRVR